MMKETKFKKPTKFKNVRKWQPNEWEPVYEKIVFESSYLNCSNKTLAVKYGFTEQHISNILNTEKAREIKGEIVAALRQGSLEKMEKQFDAIVVKSVDNMHTVLHNEEALKNAPFGMFDRSIAALKSLGKLKDDAKPGNSVINNNITQNTMIINAQQETKIIEGLNKLEQIKLLHGEVSADSIK